MVCPGAGRAAEEPDPTGVGKGGQPGPEVQQ